MKIEWIEKYLREAEELITHENLEGGLQLLNGLLYDEPGYGSLHNHLGWAYFYNTPEVEKAEMHFKLAVKFDPEFAPPYQHLGHLYLRTGKYPEALTWFKRGLGLAQANKYVMLEGMAQTYEWQKEYGHAIAHYKKALFSTLGAESHGLQESIKRCRKKRITLFFTF